MPPNPFPRITKLAARMDLLGYTVTDVANGAGVNRWHLNDYLHKRKQIAPIHLARLCTFLKCSPESLVENPK